MSSALAFTSDLTMGVVGGKLKFMERLSARLGDVLSQLYIASAVLKFYLEGSKSDAERAHARWAPDTSLYEIGQAFDGFIRNFPVAWGRFLLRLLSMPLGHPFHPVRARRDRTSDGQGPGGTVRVVIGGRRSIEKKKIY